MFERQIGRKHPRYYSTTRLGRNLKDRCTKADPEREVLHKMLEELRSKWTSLRTEISQKSVTDLAADPCVDQLSIVIAVMETYCCDCRQTQLDAQLLESGRLLEASKSLVDWLEKSEELLSDKHPLRGDQDTVTSLIEQHKVSWSASSGCWQ